MDHDAGRVWAGRRAGVVARVVGVRPGDEEARGARLLLGHHADAAALRIVDHVAAVVPVDERRRLRRVLHHARQVDVAAALDVQLRVRHDLRRWNCNNE